MRNRLIIFAKMPKPGFCKTRLVPPLTYEQASKIHQASLDDLLDEVGDFDTVLYITGGDGYQNFFPEKKQLGDDLGGKMYQALENELEQYDKAILIGADAPQINTALIRKAFAALDEHDVVLGPANDGGYYLIGLKSSNKEVFKDINWGSETVLEETLNAIQRQKLSYTLLPCLIDIDNWQDIVEVNPQLKPRTRLAQLVRDYLK